jgi:uncharacterized membrane protein YqjE
MGGDGADRAADGAAKNAAHNAPNEQTDPSDSPSLLTSIKALWQELPGLVSDRVDLLSLELKRAGVALAQIVVLGVAVAVLGFTAWVLLWGAIVASLVAWGLHLALAMLVALLLNAVAAAVVLARVQTQLALLSLPATRRHLTVKAAVEPLKPSGPPPRTASAMPSPSVPSASSAPSPSSGNAAALASDARLPRRAA